MLNISTNIDLLLQSGLAHHQAGRLAEAEAAYRQVLAQQPRNADALHFLGVLAGQVGQVDVAVDLFRQAIAIRPNHADYYNNLGRLLIGHGKFDAAIEAYGKSTAIRPNDPEVYNNLAVAYQGKGQLDEAIARYRQAIALKPDYAEAFSNMGVALSKNRRPDEAHAALRQSIALNPDFSQAYLNLGNALKDSGQLDEAVAAYRRAASLDPSNTANSNLIYTLEFHPDYDARGIFEECRRFHQLHAEPLKSTIRPHRNDRHSDRRLKIGYVSPDFCAQAESYFAVPLLKAHDHRDFEIHCYASVKCPDPVTAAERQAADAWHDVLGKTDAEVAEQIRRDEIDILVDLTMHMSDNRLLLFARKPAPVQVTWLAYPGTTGLTAIDYRITDAFMDPPDTDTSVYSEQSIRLPDCWVVYDPLIEAPPAAPREISAMNPICFGSLNNPCKMNAPLLEVWANLLKAAPGSRLLLLAGLAGQRETIQRLFDKAGIEPGRVEFVGYQPVRDYLRLYDRIDIAIDPLPYNGITTTCDALWMGVPVVTMTGKTAAGRAGLAMLSVLGMPELVARTPEEFVRIAAGLAKDLPRLKKLRSTSRGRMEKSPLMDAGRFARNMEAAYRQMWRRWCETGGNAC